MELEHIRLFRAPGAKETAEGLSLHVAGGAFHLICGRAGSGKGALMQMMGLMREPVSGKFRLFGEAIGRLSDRAVPRLRRRIGVVSGACPHFGRLSVRDNIALPLWLDGKSSRAKAKNLVALMEWTGLAPIAGQRAATLPPGKAGILALAVALARAPDLLLVHGFHAFHAPFPDMAARANEGDKDALSFFAFLRELHRAGKTILLASSRPDAIAPHLPFPHGVTRLEAGQLGGTAGRAAPAAHFIAGKG